MPNVAEMYMRDEDHVLGEVKDNFERKLNLSHEHYSQDGAEEVNKRKNVSIILLGELCSTILTVSKDCRLSTESLCEFIRKRVLTKEYTRAYIRE